MSSPTLVVVRHGETDWNAISRYQGQQDIPLNDTGRRQASENGRTLRSWLTISGHDPDSYRWLVSPLSRCRESAELIRQSLGVEPDSYQTDERLKEISFGDWEGQLSDELKAVYPDIWQERRADPWSHTPPNGESYQSLAERIQEFIAEVLDAGEDEPAVLVVHGGVIRVFQKLLLGVDAERAPKLPVPQDRLLLVDRDRQRGIWL